MYNCLSVLCMYGTVYIQENPPFFLSLLFFSLYYMYSTYIQNLLLSSFPLVSLSTLANAHTPTHRPTAPKNPQPRLSPVQFDLHHTLQVCTSTLGGGWYIRDTNAPTLWPLGTLGVIDAGFRLAAAGGIDRTTVRRERGWLAEVGAD